jgi:uncharacterized protein (TIGR00725 family)
VAVYVAVCGAGVATPDEEAIAEEIGRRLAERGAVVVSGGMTGVMEASCRGAKASGGTTLGILPGTDRREANEFIDLAIPTGMGEMRNALIVRAADVLIAVSGEFGTLSEVALALNIGVPVVGLTTWELGKSGERVEAFEAADSPEEAVTRALALADPSAGEGGSRVRGT